jgi:extracellular matrix regulatory protein A
MRFINIGFGNIISDQHVIAIASPDSAPIRRLMGEAKERGQLIDATYGRKTRAVIVMNSGHVVLAAVQPETIASRANEQKD